MNTCCLVGSDAIVVNSSRMVSISCGVSLSGSIPIQNSAIPVSFKRSAGAATRSLPIVNIFFLKTRDVKIETL